jgi:transposase
MRFYNQRHRFYCGIDLHTRMMYVCIVDEHGQVLVHQNSAANPSAFLKLIAPYRDGIVVCVECLFTWYWLADLCQAEKIPFVLGHALLMKAIHGGKAKNDRIDSAKIAQLLRGGNLPYAYVYPQGMRETRDLLRRRLFLVRRRAEAMAHIQNTYSQYNFAPLPKKLLLASSRGQVGIAERFEHPSVRKSVAVDLTLIDHYDTIIHDVEQHLVQTVKVDDLQTYHRLQTVPGIGKILGLVLLYEIHDIGRFAQVGDFLSYARLVRCVHESAGKKTGSGGHKMGNVHLKWAFSELACCFLAQSERAKKWLSRQEKKHGKKKALAILSARLGRAVYFILRKQLAFDERRFWAD